MVVKVIKPVYNAERVTTIAKTLSDKMSVNDSGNASVPGSLFTEIAASEFNLDTATLQSVADMNNAMLHAGLRVAGELLKKNIATDQTDGGDTKKSSAKFTMPTPDGRWKFDAVAFRQTRSPINGQITDHYGTVRAQLITKGIVEETELSNIASEIAGLVK
jgi:hypothetical protein